MIHKIIYKFFLLFVFIMKILPQKMRNIFFRYLSLIVYFFAKKTKKVIKINLEMVFGKERLTQEETKKITKYCFYNMALWIKSTIENSFLKKEDIEDKFEYINKKIVDKALESEKKVIFISAHFGNFEILGYAINAYITPIVHVVRESNFKEIDKFINDARAKTGAQIIYKDGAIKKLVRAIKQNKVVSLVIDQNMNYVEGTAIQFFGHEAYQTSGAAFLSRKFDTIVIPVAIFNQDEDDKYQIKFYQPIKKVETENQKEDIKKLTQLQANAMETIIKEDPKQWFWCHKRWKSTFEHIYK